MENPSTDNGRNELQKRSQDQTPDLNAELPQSDEPRRQEAQPDKGREAPELKIESADFGELEAEEVELTTEVTPASSPGTEPSPEAAPDVNAANPSGESPFEGLDPDPFVSRKDKLIGECEQAGKELAEICERAHAKLEELPKLGQGEIAKLSVHELQDYVEKYRDCEEAMREAVTGVSRLASKLADEIAPDAAREYKARTGFLDNPAVNEKLAGAASLAGIALTFAGLFYGGIHAIEHAVGHIASGFLNHGISYGLAFFGMCVGSAAASYVYGFAKTCIGRLIGGDYLEQEKKNAAEVQQAIVSAVQQSGGQLGGFAEDIQKFSQVSRELRTALSEAIIARSEGAEVPEGTATLAALEDFSRSLTWSEPRPVLQLCSARRRLHALENVDILPRENFWEAVHESGPGAAMTLWSRGKKGCHEFEMGDQSNSVMDALADLAKGGAGSGKALCGLLEMMVQGGVRLDDAVLDTFKGGFGIADNLANMGQGKKDGPTALELLYMVAAGDEIQKGNYAKAGGELIPNLALILLKKIYFVIESERHAAAQGDVSPNMLGREMNKKTPYHEQVWHKLQDVAHKVPSIVTGLVNNLCIELPLWTFSRVPSVAKLRDDYYAMRQNAAQTEMDKHAMKIEPTLPPGTTLDGMSKEALTMHVVKRMIAWEKGEPGTSSEEIKALLSYWEKRDRHSWYGGWRHKFNHDRELLDNDSRPSGSLISGKRDLEYLPKYLRQYDRGAAPEPEPKEPPKTIYKQFWSGVGWLVGSAASGIKSGVTALWRTASGESKDIEGFIEKYNRGEHKPSPEPVVIDAANDGSLVVKGTDGKLSFLRKNHARNFVMNECWDPHRAEGSLPVHVLPYANVARLSVADKLLDTNTTHDQRMALLSAHYAAYERGASVTEQARILAAGGFSMRQIFGPESGAQHAQTRCILTSGLIGNRVPTAEEVAAARQALAAA